MSLTILFHFLCAQRVSDIYISIIRSLRLFCWFTTLVVLFLVSMCVGDLVRLGWSGIRVAGFSQPHRISNTHRTKNNTTSVVIQQPSRKLLMMDMLRSDNCWTHKKWTKIVASNWSFILHHLLTLKLLRMKYLIIINTKLFTFSLLDPPHLC